MKEITLAEFRGNAELVKAVREMFEMPPMKLLLEAMESENPARKVAPPSITPHGAYIMLGEQTGWQQFKQRFLLGGVGLEARISDGPQSYLVDPDKPTAEASNETE